MAKDICYFWTIGEGIVTKTYHATSDGNRAQIATTIETIVAYASYAIWDEDGSKTFRTSKRILAYSCNVICFASIVNRRWNCYIANVFSILLGDDFCSFCFLVKMVVDAIYTTKLA